MTDSFSNLTPRALHRYLVHDTWNILDICFLLLISTAFVSRMIAMRGTWNDDDEIHSGDTEGDHLQENAFFIARSCLSAIAPFLFARSLFLLQIDFRLGPMTQVNHSVDETRYSKGHSGTIIRSGVAEDFFQLLATDLYSRSLMPHE